MGYNAYLNFDLHFPSGCVEQILADPNFDEAKQAHTSMAQSAGVSQMPSEWIATAITELLSSAEDPGGFVGSQRKLEMPVFTSIEDAEEWMDANASSQLGVTVTGECNAKLYSQFELLGQLAVNHGVTGTVTGLGEDNMNFRWILGAGITEITGVVVFPDDPNDPVLADINKEVEAAVDRGNAYVDAILDKLEMLITNGVHDSQIRSAIERIVAARPTIDKEIPA